MFYILHVLLFYVIYSFFTNSRRFVLAHYEIKGNDNIVGISKNMENSENLKAKDKILNTMVIVNMKNLDNKETEKQNSPLLINNRTIKNYEEMDDSPSNKKNIVYKNVVLKPKSRIIKLDTSPVKQAQDDTKKVKIEKDIYPVIKVEESDKTIGDKRTEIKDKNLKTPSVGEKAKIFYFPEEENPCYKYFDKNKSGEENSLETTQKDTSQQNAIGLDSKTEKNDIKVMDYVLLVFTHPLNYTKNFFSSIWNKKGKKDMNESITSDINHKYDHKLIKNLLVEGTKDVNPNIKKDKKEASTGKSNVATEQNKQAQPTDKIDKQAKTKQKKEISKQSQVKKKPKQSKDDSDKPAKKKQKKEESNKPQTKPPPSDLSKKKDIPEDSKSKNIEPQQKPAVLPPENENISQDQTPEKTSTSEQSNLPTETGDTKQTQSPNEPIDKSVATSPTQTGDQPTTDTEKPPSTSDNTTPTTQPISTEKLAETNIKPDSTSKTSTTQPISTDKPMATRNIPISTPTTQPISTEKLSETNIKPDSTSKTPTTQPISTDKPMATNTKQTTQPPSTDKPPSADLKDSSLKKQAKTDKVKSSKDNAPPQKKPDLNKKPIEKNSSSEPKKTLPEKEKKSNIAKNGDKELNKPQKTEQNTKKDSSTIKKDTSTPTKDNIPKSSTTSKNLPEKDSEKKKGEKSPTKKDTSADKKSNAPDERTKVSYDKAKKALTDAVLKTGKQPKQKYMDLLVSLSGEKNMTINEKAMIMAQMAYESDGFTTLEEYACKNKICPQYGKGAPGKSYHGRGLMQLSWPENYKAAGQALGYGNSLYDTPELVADNPRIAMETAMWYWKNRVDNQPGFDLKKFGSTTKAINGALECGGTKSPAVQKRYDLYKDIATGMGVENIATPDGC